jgi:hypothetical protein
MQRLGGHEFSVSFDRKGRATISGGDDVAVVQVEPIAEEYCVSVYVTPQWPAIYVYTADEARTYLAGHPGGIFQEDHGEYVKVRWSLRGEPDLNFADLSDVMLYASITSRA